MAHNPLTIHYLTTEQLKEYKSFLLEELNRTENGIIELNQIEWNKNRDKAERTYKRWDGIRIELMGLMGIYLTTDHIPDREEFLAVKAGILNRVELFREMIDVYGNDWIVYKVKANGYFTDKNLVIAGIGPLVKRLNDIGFKLYPDLMF